MTMKIGQVVQAKVVEHILDNTYIVILEGRLIRVVNTSGKKLKTSQLVKLRVVGLAPLTFQIFGLNKSISIQI